MKDFNELVGHTITAICIDSEGSIKFELASGYKCTLYHEPDPSTVSISTDSQQSLNDLIGSPKTVGKSMPVPSAATGPDGIMFYSWDMGPHHLEIEIYPDRCPEFFYRNRETSEHCGDDIVDGPLPEVLVSKLRLFLCHQRTRVLVPGVHRIINER